MKTKLPCHSHNRKFQDMVSHRLMDQLTVISGHCELGMLHASESCAARRQLEAILATARKAAALVRHLHEIETEQAWG